VREQELPDTRSYDHFDRASKNSKQQLEGGSMSFCVRPGLNTLVGVVGMTIAAGTASAQEASTDAIEEITVTAQRRAERLTDVPISLTAYSDQRMDQQGVRSIDDIARLTPGITFTRGDARNAGAGNIAIRGISSTVATSTTGIYIDDTPIQTRIIGAGASNYNVFPAVFDLERVEVLRGPQGTLFGSGSEGGTLRFITPKPSLDTYSMYARAESGFIDRGGQSYELGAAIGGPIVNDKLGFRLTAMAKRDGGYVDRVNTDPKAGDAPLAVFDNDPSTPPTILPARNKVNFVAEKDSNFQEARVAKGALSFVPVDGLEMIASVYYQNIDYNDTNTWWRALSDTDDGVYRQGNALRQPSKDRFTLPALAINWDLGPVRLVSNTSYFDRNQRALNDYTAFESALWARNWTFPVGMQAPTTQINTQKGITQELRLEGGEEDSRIKWVAGAFYQKYRQESKQFVEDTFLPNLFQDVTGVPFVVALGPLADGLYTFKQDSVIAHDEQLAGFAQVDLKLVDKLTLTAGLRYAETKFDATAHYEGPVVGPPVNDAGEKTEHPLTPKVGLSYKFTRDNLLYATAAKGFRVGGYNPQVGLPCGPLLASQGYVPSAGNPTGRPATFNSDSLWSYEIGSKNVLNDGRAQISGSAYYINWKDIQQAVVLGSCGFQFTANLGKAVSQGVDLDASFRLGSSLTLGTAIGYNDAKFKETVFGGPGATVSLVSDGDHIPGAPWTVTLNGQYDFTVGAREAFVRFDYEYRSQGPDDTSALNVANRSPVLPPPDPETFVRLPATSLLSLRTGVQIGGANASFFVKNLLNKNPLVTRADLSFGGPPHGYTAQTVLPRTVGATLTYRY
jgi:outer membrane receptor protein involved in Fe transport